MTVTATRPQVRSGNLLRVEIGFETLGPSRLPNCGRHPDYHCYFGTISVVHEALPEPAWVFR